jgi:hypothetical protein
VIEAGKGVFEGVVDLGLFGDVEGEDLDVCRVLCGETGEMVGVRAVATTLAPSARSCSASRRPKPVEAPVMNQTLPCCEVEDADVIGMGRSGGRWRCKDAAKERHDSGAARTVGVDGPMILLVRRI